MTTLPAKITSPTAAIRAACDLLAPVPAFDTPLLEACGMIAACDATTDRPSPPFDASAMDGFAVSTAHLRAGRVRIIGEVRIGTDPGRLDASQGVMRMVTGGALPRGANAVIKREDVTEHDDDTITIEQAVIDRCRPGLAVRPTGENAAASTRVPLAGREITAPVAGAFASAGAVSIAARRPVRIAIITTGDELVGHDEQPGPFQLRDSNGLALLAMLARRRWLACSPPLRVHDDPDAAKQAAGALLATHDCLVFTGGVSMGHRDFVPDLVSSLGAQRICHTLPQRPGKPILLAAAGNTLIAGLPGNPQSVMVTARRILLPILAHMAGLTTPLLVPKVPLVHDAGMLNLWWYRPVTLDAHGVAHLVDGRGSGDLIAAGRSDGFIELEPNQVPAAGELVPFHAWAW